MNNLSPNQIGKIFTLLTHISTGKLHSNKKDKVDNEFKGISKFISNGFYCFAVSIDYFVD